MGANAMDTERLRRLIERPTAVRWWGQPRTITPRVVGAVIGDGKKLIGIAPIMYRPNHFVARIDSRHALSWHKPNGPDVWLDALYEAIEGEYCEWPWADDYWPGEEDGDQRRVDFSDGASWWEEEWPRQRQD